MFHSLKIHQTCIIFKFSDYFEIRGNVTVTATDLHVLKTDPVIGSMQAFSPEQGSWRGLVAFSQSLIPLRPPTTILQPGLQSSLPWLQLLWTSAEVAKSAWPAIGQFFSVLPSAWPLSSFEPLRSSTAEVRIAPLEYDFKMPSQSSAYMKRLNEIIKLSGSGWSSPQAEKYTMPMLHLRMMGGEWTRCEARNVQVRPRHLLPVRAHLHPNHFSHHNTQPSKGKPQEERQKIKVRAQERLRCNISAPF